MLSKYRSAIFTLIGLCFAGIAHAQAIPWDSDVIVWTGGGCSSGAPTSVCTNNYRVETAATTAGPWTKVVDTTSTTFTLTKLLPGQHCYRIVAVGSTEAVSNVLCSKTDPGTPLPPVLQTVDTVAMSVRPDYQRLLFVAYNQVGRVPLGTRCSTTIADGYATVPVASVKWTGSSRPQTVVAQCAAS